MTHSAVNGDRSFLLPRPSPDEAETLISTELIEGFVSSITRVKSWFSNLKTWSEFLILLLAFVLEGSRESALGKNGGTFCWTTLQPPSVSDFGLFTFCCELLKMSVLFLRDGTARTRAPFQRLTQRVSKKGPDSKEHEWGSHLLNCVIEVGNIKGLLPCPLTSVQGVNHFKD